MSGGVFSRRGTSSLATRRAPLGELSPNDQENYPWGVQAPGTRGYQMGLSSLAPGAGYCQLEVTGVLDAKTCGLARALGVQTPATCESFVEPRRAPCDTPQDLSVLAPGAMYAYGQQRPETLNLQQALNLAAARDGLCPVPLTGVLDAATCALAKRYNVAPPTCAQAGPLPDPPSCAPAPSLPPSAPTPTSVSVRPQQSSAWVVGAVLVVGVAAAYWAGRPKKRASR